MEQIVEQLIELNNRDWLDVVGILVPIILTIALFVQNSFLFNRSEKLQKEIHNRDLVNQAHEDILRIYRSYYEFNDFLYASQFAERVRHGDVSFANSFLNNLFDLTNHMYQVRDLARLLLSANEPETYNAIASCIDNEIEILQKYHSYICSGRLYEASENAWNTVLASSVEDYQAFAKYNYQELYKNSNRYNNFLSLCKTPELEEIEALLKKDNELHSYDNYDAYFEKHLRLEKL